MEAEFFQHGNYIYECKTSPSKMGEYFSTNYLNSSLRKLRERWKNGNLPSGYRYVFPINNLDDNGKAALKKLQEEYPNVDIRYYEYEQVDNLVKQLNKVNSMSDLVEYIENVRNNPNGNITEDKEEEASFNTEYQEKEASFNTEDQDINSVYVAVMLSLIFGLIISIFLFSSNLFY